MKSIFNPNLISEYRRICEHEMKNDYNTEKELKIASREASKTAIVEIRKCKEFQSFDLLFKLFDSFPLSREKYCKFCKFSYGRWKEIFKWIIDGYLDELEQIWSKNCLLIDNKNKLKYDYNYEMEWFDKYWGHNNKYARISNNSKKMLQNKQKEFCSRMKRAKKQCIERDIKWVTRACHIIEQQMSNKNKNNNNNLNNNYGNSDCDLAATKACFEAIIDDIAGPNEKVIKISIPNVTNSSTINLKNINDEHKANGVPSGAICQRASELRELGRMDDFWVVIEMSTQDIADKKAMETAIEYIDNLRCAISVRERNVFHKLGFVWFRGKSHLAFNFCICGGKEGELRRVYHAIKSMANDSKGKIAIKQAFEDIDDNIGFEISEDNKDDADFNWLVNHKDKINEYANDIYSVCRKLILKKQKKQDESSVDPHWQCVREILSVGYKRWDEIIKYLKIVGSGEKLCEEIKIMFEQNKDGICRYAFGVESAYYYDSQTIDIITLERKKFERKLSHLKQVSIFIDIICLGMACYIVENLSGKSQSQIGAFNVSINGNIHMALCEVLNCLKNGNKTLRGSICVNRREIVSDCQRVYQQLRYLHFLRKKRKDNEIDYNNSEDVCMKKPITDCTNSIGNETHSQNMEQNSMISMEITNPKKNMFSLHRVHRHGSVSVGQFEPLSNE